MSPDADRPSPATFGFEGDRPGFPEEDATPREDTSLQEDTTSREDTTDDFAQRPHVYLGAAFVGGLVAAKVLGRITRG